MFNNLLLGKFVASLLAKLDVITVSKKVLAQQKSSIITNGRQSQ